MTGPAEVLLMEASWDQGGLDAVLEPRQAAELRAELHAQAAQFASRAAPGGFHTAPPEARLSQAVYGVHAAQPPGEAPHSAPLLVVWPELARLGGWHAAGALEDLRSGADVVFGPVIDGGLYLLGLWTTFGDLLERLDEALHSGDLGMPGLAEASDMGLEIGLLRVERGLRTASDVEAALADPLTPPQIRRILEPPGGCAPEGPAASAPA